MQARSRSNNAFPVVDFRLCVSTPHPHPKKSTQKSNNKKQTKKQKTKNNTKKSWDALILSGLAKLYIIHDRWKWQCIPYTKCEVSKVVWEQGGN